MRGRLFSHFAAFCLLGSPAVYAVNQAQALLQSNRLDQAKAVCQQVEVLGTRDQEILYSCAWVYFRGNKSDKAQRILDQLRSQVSKPEYQLLVAYDYIQKKQWDFARSILDSLQTTHRKKAIGISAQELYGEMYDLMGQPDTAAFLYKQIIGDDPKRIRAQWALGQYYLKKGDPRRAQTHFETVAAAWPVHVESRYQLALLALSQDNMKEAGIRLGECQRLERNNPLILEQLGNFFEKKGNIPEAVKYWQLAINVKKDSVVAKEKLSLHLEKILDIFIANKQYKQALNQLTKSIPSIQTQPKFLYQRGVILKNLGKYEKALVDFQSYLNTDPKDFKNLFQEMGICYVNMKLLDKSIDSFHKAIKLHPDDGDSHAWMGFALEAKGETRAAYEYWKKAVDLIKDPHELQKASRKLANIEKKVNRSPQSDEHQ